MTTNTEGNQGSKVSTFSASEWELRLQLAASYRLFDLFGWSDLIYNHLTVRLSEESDHFLINPFGLLFSEITASSLVKIDINGNIIDGGSTNLGINKTGYVIHSAIHGARKDILCVMHCHSTCGVAVSCMKDGLLPISQNSAILGNISYHDYEGLSVNLEERERLVEHLGPQNKIMILRNHGLLTCGSSVAEAFFNMYMLNRACEIQVSALSVGIQNLIFPPQKFFKFTELEASQFNCEGIGQKEFASLIRKLDRIDNSYKQ